MIALATVQKLWFWLMISFSIKFFLGKLKKKDISMLCFLAGWGGGGWVGVGGTWFAYMHV